MNFRHINSKATLAFTQTRAAIAICNTEADSFSKAQGRLIAGGRLDCGRAMVSSSSPLSRRLIALLTEQRPVELKEGEIGPLIHGIREYFERKH